MKRIFALILLAGAMLAGLNAETPIDTKRWLPIGAMAAISKTATGDAAAYIDTETIDHDGDSLTVWEQIIQSGDQRLRRALTRLEFRRDRKFRVLSTVVYDSTDEVIGSWNDREGWQDIVPGSMQEDVSNHFDTWVAIAEAKAAEGNNRPAAHL